MTLRPIILASLLVAPFQSTLADESRWRLSPYAGFSSLGDASGQTDSGQPVTVETNGGFVAGLRAEYAMTNNLRGVAGWEYRSNDSTTRIDPAAGLPGNYASNTFHLGGKYLFPTRGRFTTYIGGGINWIQEVDLDLEAAVSETSYSGDGSVGVELSAGVEAPLGDRWILDLAARYQRFGTQDLTLESLPGTVTGVDYDPLTLSIGLSYRF